MFNKSNTTSTLFNLQVSSAFWQRQRKGPMRQKPRYWLEEEEWVTFYRLQFVNMPRSQRQETDQNTDPAVQVPHLDCASINWSMSWVSVLLGHISALYTDEGNLIKEREYQMLLRKCKYKEPGIFSKSERTNSDHVSGEKKMGKNANKWDLAAWLQFSVFAL